MDETTAHFEALGEEKVRSMLATGSMVSHLIVPAHEWLTSKVAPPNAPEPESTVEPAAEVIFENHEEASED